MSSINSSNDRDRFPRWGIWLLILILPLVLYSPFLFGGQRIFWGTPSLQFWPWRQFAADELRAGRLSLWNPDIGSGTPQLADHQTAVLYPLNVILWLLPVPYALGLSLALHAALAAAGMFALSREMGLSRLASLIAALSLAFSGYMVARGSFLTEIGALAWLPLLWLLARCTVRRPDALNVALLALVIAVQFLAGHAQTWFYSMLSLGPVALWEMWKAQIANRKWRMAGRDLLIPLCCLLLAVVWGVMLTGAQFLPTVELGRLAERANRADWERFSLQYSFWPWRVLTLFAPDFFGTPAGGDFWGYATYWEDAGYIGLLPILLAFWAVLAWLRRRKNADKISTVHETPFWAALALIALLLAMGKNMPLYMLLYRYVPGFNSFQAPARLLCIYTPALALLAGLGLDALRPSERLGKACIWGLVISLGILLAGGAAAVLFAGVKATFIGATIKAAVWGALSCALLWLGNRVWEYARWNYVWQWAVVLFVAADLIAAGWALNPRIDAAFYQHESTIGAFLAGDGQGRTFFFADPLYDLAYRRYLRFDTFGPRDLYFWLTLRESLLPDLGSVEGVPGANSFEPLVQARYFALLQEIEEMPQETALRTLGLMNVAYVLDPSDELGLEIAYRSPTVNVHRNPHLLPRAYVVYQAHLAASPQEALAALAAPDFDPANQVILELAHPQLATFNPQLATFNPQPDSCTLLPSPPNQVKINAILSQSGYLVLADTFYPGWTATVDGQAAEILRANYAFRAVALDAGAHTVEFRYRPRSFAVGVACSAVGLAALVIVGLTVRAQRQAKRKPPQGV
ncbi:MAG: YfhO family protein [Anaerolineae bacterium]|nr:YfhO family protein [Anaerolineae bacterium]